MLHFERVGSSAGLARQKLSEMKDAVIPGLPGPDLNDSIIRAILSQVCDLINEVVPFDRSRRCEVNSTPSTKPSTKTLLFIPRGRQTAVGSPTPANNKTFARELAARNALVPIVNPSSSHVHHRNSYFECESYASVEILRGADCRVLHPY